MTLSPTRQNVIVIASYTRTAATEVSVVIVIPISYTIIKFELTAIVIVVGSRLQSVVISP